MHHFAGKHMRHFALSLHTLSHIHTTLTNKSHIKYKVHKIEHNYNQIWYIIKANIKLLKIATLQSLLLAIP